MTNVVEMTLAALVGLVANVHTGLESLSHKNYEEAIVSFSTVINAEPSVKDMRALSLLYRAEAYAGKGQKAEALADAVTLLKTSDDSEIKRKAAAIYTAQGGILANLRPKDGPKATLDEFLDSLQKSDFKSAKHFLSRPLLQMIEAFDSVFISNGEPTFFLRLAQKSSGMSIIQESFDDTNRTASILLGEEHAKLAFELVAQDESWTLSSVGSAGHQWQKMMTEANPIVTQNKMNMLMCFSYLQIFSMKNQQRFPAHLEDLSLFGLDVSLFQYRDPATDKKGKFLFRGGLKATDDTKTIIVAAPFVINGGRDVMFVNGSIVTLSEAEFTKKSIEQKWAALALIKKADVPKDVAAEVTGLIGSLGSQDPAVRAAARKRLKEIGLPSRPFLREQRGHADPEVRTAVRELLK